jgi:hypothetical protein
MSNVVADRSIVIIKNQSFTLDHIKSQKKKKEQIGTLRKEYSVGILKIGPPQMVLLVRNLVGILKIASTNDTAKMNSEAGIEKNSPKLRKHLFLLEMISFGFKMVSFFQREPFPNSIGFAICPR